MLKFWLNLYSNLLYKMDRSRLLGQTVVPAENTLFRVSLTFPPVRHIDFYWLSLGACPSQMVFKPGLRIRLCFVGSELQKKGRNRYGSEHLDSNSL